MRHGASNGGGLGLTPTLVQERLGYSTIGMTLDVYGHLFPRGDDGSELAAAERLGRVRHKRDINAESTLKTILSCGL